MRFTISGLVLLIAGLPACAAGSGEPSDPESLAPAVSQDSGESPDDTADDSPYQLVNEVDWLAEVGSLDQVVEASEPAGFREDGSGAFRTHCLESHIGPDDPLVWPGDPGMSHLHVFFGNPDTDAFTTTTSLQETSSTTCDGVSLNKSGYWVPALLGADGERIPFIDPLFYYKTGYHAPAEQIEPMPEGLTIIAGDMASSQPQDVEVAKFRCLSWEAPEPQFSPGDPLDHVPYIPDCAEGDIVEMRLVFPQCWDGENITSADHKSHMAYPIPAEAPDVGTGYCPESHPVALPEISYNFGVRVTGETGPSTKWRFITDPIDAKQGGYSFHGDWMNGWDEDTMEQIVSSCLNEGRECMVGLLGNGRQLQPVPLDDD
jgi:hypothetical protein